MAATGYTPIYLYYSSTSTNAPSAGNLGYGELALNITDKNLFFKDNTNTVNTVPIRQSSGSSDGWLSSANWTTFNNKQAALVSGTNIKTVSGTSLLGSGDLGTIGVGYGGTGTSTAFTAGSVVFAGVSGVYSQNNSYLFWDNSNRRLGIGTATPAYSLDVQAGYTAIQAQFLRYGDYGELIRLGRVGVAGSAGIGYSNDNYLSFYTNATEQAYINGSGDLNLKSGNLVIGTSGKGIDFSATPGTGTSELLADYEEGTWTPAIGFDGNSVGVTYTSRSGKYVKIGNVVYVTFDLVLSSKGSSTGGTGISGLPYTANSSIGVACAIGYYASLNSALTIQCRFADSNTVISLGKPTSAAGMQNVPDTDITDTTRLSGSGYYFVF